MKKILRFQEKHGTRVFDASTEEKVEAACLKVLQDRYDDDYWYYDNAKESAEKILEAKNGKLARQFLMRRRHNEYEYMELHEVEDATTEDQ